MQVVEDEHKQLLLPRLAQQRRDGLEQPVPRALGIAGEGVAERRHALGEFRDHPPQLAADEAHLGLQQILRAGADVMAQRLHERLVGQQRLLVAAAVQDDRPGLLRVARNLPREPRLADPGLAAQHDELACPRRRPLEGRGDTARGRGTPHERLLVVQRQRWRQRERRSGRRVRSVLGPRRRVSADRRDDRVGIEPRRVPEDRLLQRLQRRARTQPQLAAQPRAGGQTELRSQTMYRTRFGPVFTDPGGFAWTSDTAYAVRDANAHDPRRDRRARRVAVRRPRRGQRP